MSTDATLPALIGPGTDALLHAAGQVLSTTPYAMVTLAEVAAVAGVPTTALTARYGTVHALASAVLDHERSTMRAVQARVAREVDDPLERLRTVFGQIGETVAADVVVRAGMRIAFESREHFPERRLDPFATWAGFVTAALIEAHSTQRLRAGVDVDEAAWLIVMAGVGTKDHLALHDEWPDAPRRFLTTITAALSLIVEER